MHKAQLYRILLVTAIVITFVISLFAAFFAFSADAARNINTNTNTIMVNVPGSEPADYHIDINRSSAEALATLPGIGPTLAQRIIDGRPYADVYELDRVDGIGPETIDGLAGKVVW